jgi:DNA-directed RNA polymerase specialized sigma24 family protein
MSRVAHPDPEPLEESDERGPDHERPQGGKGGDTGVNDLVPVPDYVLDDVETDVAGAGSAETAEEVDRRLAADRKIVELLAADGYQGPRFDALASRLAEYAWPILLKWLSTGEIFAQCERCRRVARRHEAQWDWTADERYRLATETVLEAIEFFREQALRRGRWDWRRGASLKTYFVGACLCCFGKVYNRWWREQVLAAGITMYGLRAEDHPTAVAADRRAVDPADAAVTQDEVFHALAPMNDMQLRLIVGLRAIGYTQREAADRAGLTEKAAERRLARHRRKLGTEDVPPGHASIDDGRRGVL